jgi:hypothetical protein
MVRYHRILPLMAALAGAAILGMPPPAEAAFKLKMSVAGGPSIEVEDVNDDGLVGYFGDLGAFTVNVTVGASKPLLGNPFLADMDITSLNVTTSTGGELTIELTDTGFSVLPTSESRFHLVSSATGNVFNGSVTFQSIVDMRDNGENEFTSASDVDGATVVSTGVQGPLSGAFGGGSPIDSLRTLEYVGTNPFSMTSITTIKLNPYGFSSFDGRTSVMTPEPSGTALVLAGLPILGAFQWWRRRKS